MWTGAPVKANTLDRAGDGQTSAPDFCIFASPLVLLPVFLRRTHKGKHACKNEHPERRRRRTDFRSRFLYFYIVPGFFSWGFFAKNTCWQAARKKANTPAAQAAARLTSLIPASSSGPADREDFCGQCASDSRIWIAAVTSSEMFYHRAAPPLAEAGAFCRVSFSPAGFLYRKRTGPKACPFFESMGKRSINSWLRGSGRMPWDVHIRGKPREPSRPRGCSRSWSTAIQPSRSWQILRPSLH